jgi:hypothetical protein
LAISDNKGNNNTNGNAKSNQQKASPQRVLAATKTPKAHHEGHEGKIEDTKECQEI